MLTNRSMPRSSVIPELAYPDVGRAIGWLCDVFGFTLRVRIASHRAQLNVEDGAVVLTERHPSEAPAASGAAPAPVDRAHAVMVRVVDVDGHHERAARKGARILRAPETHPYGERQYTVEDLGGHVWTFSQSIGDVAPEDWGGTSGHL